MKSLAGNQADKAARNPAGVLHNPYRNPEEVFAGIAAGIYASILQVSCMYFVHFYFRNSCKNYWQ